MLNKELLLAQSSKQMGLLEITYSSDLGRGDLIITNANTSENILYIDPVPKIPTTTRITVELGDKFIAYTHRVEMSLFYEKNIQIVERELDRCVLPGDDISLDVRT